MKAQKQYNLIHKKISELMHEMDKLHSEKETDKRKLLQAGKHLLIAARILDQPELIEYNKKAGDHY